MKITCILWACWEEWIKQKPHLSVSPLPPLRKEPKAEVGTSSRYSPEWSTFPKLGMQTNSKRDLELEKKKGCFLIRAVCQMHSNRHLDLYSSLELTKGFYFNELQSQLYSVTLGLKPGLLILILVLFFFSYSYQFINIYKLCGNLDHEIGRVSTWISDCGFE